MLLPIIAAAAVSAVVQAAPTASDAEYDYVVIGSGPGGGTLAASLAKAGQSVLLIEAGGDASEDIQQLIPSMSVPTAHHAVRYITNTTKELLRSRESSQLLAILC
jgi:choline dehydrogenase-like flavoprotein